MSFNDFLGEYDHLGKLHEDTFRQRARELAAKKATGGDGAASAGGKKAGKAGKAGKTAKAGKKSSAGVCLRERCFFL